MRGGFKRLVNPGSLVSDIDLEATRAERRRVHDLMRRRQAIERGLHDDPMWTPEPDASNKQR